MSLKAGIVGLPNVGKSTLFNAITNSHVEAANYPFATISPNTGVVICNDKRLTFLSDLFKPKKTIYATVEFYDIAGLVKGASHGEGLGNQFLAHIRETDAIVEVVRCFDSSEIIHVEGTVDPLRDIDIINIELSMADLDTVTKRIGKVEGKARINKDKEAIFEMSILKPLSDALNAGTPARKVALSQEQKDYVINNYHLLTMKPHIYVANVSEEDLMDLSKAEHYQTLKEFADKENTQVVAISCQIEAELSTLSKEERTEYLESLGVEESGLDKCIHTVYKLLNLSTFFTVGEDECRAWTFENGMTAPQCAGIIHTDFERGFIKAEVYSYTDIEKYKSESAIKEAGKLRFEGKEYHPQDGDIMFFRFNV